GPPPRGPGAGILRRGPRTTPARQVPEGLGLLRRLPLRRGGGAGRGPAGPPRRAGPIVGRAPAARALGRAGVPRGGGGRPPPERHGGRSLRPARCRERPPWRSGAARRAGGAAEVAARPREPRPGTVPVAAGLPRPARAGGRAVCPLRQRRLRLPRPAGR